jgi:hypothetical protein
MGAFGGDYLVIDCHPPYGAVRCASSEVLPHGGLTNRIYARDYLVMRRIPAFSAWIEGFPLVMNESDAVFADPVFTGWKPWKTVREKNVLRHVYHDPQGPVFAPPRNWRNGISCRLGGHL